MGKLRQSNKESKKPATLSAKEKKAQKQLKKQEAGNAPFVLPK